MLQRLELHISKLVKLTCPQRLSLIHSRKNDNTDFGYQCLCYFVHALHWFISFRLRTPSYLHPPLGVRTRDSLTTLHASYAGLTLDCECDNAYSIGMYDKDDNDNHTRVIEQALSDRNSILQVAML